MQNVNKISSLPSEFIQHYLVNIKASLKRFAYVENHPNGIRMSNDDTPTRFYEPLEVSKINYIALMTLEELGVAEPNQLQIDIIETLIVMATQLRSALSEKRDNEARPQFV